MLKLEGAEVRVNMSSASWRVRIASIVLDQLLQLEPSNWGSCMPLGMLKVVPFALDNLCFFVALDVLLDPVALCGLDIVGWFSVC